MNRQQREALRVGVASATIEGTTMSWAPQVAFTVPFRAGATEQRDGRQVRVTAVNHAVGDSIGAIAVSRIQRSGRDLFELSLISPWSDAPRFVLINEARGEAFGLPGEIGGSSEVLVLPGVWRVTQSGALNTGNTLGQDARLPPGWLSDAKIVVIDWAMRGRAPAHFAVTVR
jgi:hypothetical protein